MSAPFIYRTVEERSVGATCKTGMAASRRKMMVHRVDVIRSYRAGDRLVYWANWRCGGYSSDALIIADPEPLGGVCKHCDAVGWCVYWCFDAAGLLLYIGSTYDTHQRFLTHKNQSLWWPEVADIKKVGQPDELTARLIEQQAIRAEKPLHNKEHNRDELLNLEQAA